MKLNDEEHAMLTGACGPAQKWAIDHQMKVGRFFDAVDMVTVSQAHMMADPESLGDAGVSFVEELASNGSKVVIPMITDPRGVDLAHYQPLGQTEEMATLERRFIAGCEAIGIMMTNTCINYQTIMPPVRGDHLAYGDTGVVIYANSVSNLVAAASELGWCHDTSTPHVSKTNGTPERMIRTAEEGTNTVLADGIVY